MWSCLSLNFSRFSVISSSFTYYRPHSKIRRRFNAPPNSKRGCQPRAPKTALESHRSPSKTPPSRPTNAIKGDTPSPVAGLTFAFDVNWLARQMTLSYTCHVITLTSNSGRERHHAPKWVSPVDEHVWGLISREIRRRGNPKAAEVAEVWMAPIYIAGRTVFTRKRTHVFPGLYTSFSKSLVDCINGNFDINFTITFAVIW